MKEKGGEGAFALVCLEAPLGLIGPENRLDQDRTLDIQFRRVLRV